jgi:hypothetical protein
MQHRDHAIVEQAPTDLTSGPLAHGLVLKRPVLLRSATTERSEARLVQQPTVSDVVRDVIADVARDELAVAEGLRRLDPDTVRRRLLRRREPREPVGFGLGVVVPLMTSVSWIAIDEVVRHGLDEASDSLVRRLSAAARSFFRRLLRRPPSQLTVPPLQPAQLAAVTRKIQELAPAYGLSAEQTQALSERVVARLVLPAAELDSSP